MNPRYFNTAKCAPNNVSCTKKKWTIKKNLSKLETKKLVMLLYTTFVFISMSTNEIFKIDSIKVNFHSYQYVLFVEVLFLTSSILAAFGSTFEKGHLILPLLLIELFTFAANLKFSALPAIEKGKILDIFMSCLPIIILSYVIYCTASVISHFNKKKALNSSANRNMQFSLDSDDESVESQDRTLWTTVSILFKNMRKTPESLPRKRVFFEMPTTFSNSNVQKPYA